MTDQQTPVLREHPRFGYWYFDPPLDEVLRNHYEQRYFQANAIYASAYEEREIAFFRECARRKVRLIREHAPDVLARNAKCLEIGVGEGWSLDALAATDAMAEGIDYSSHGLLKWNPHLADSFCACVPMEELARRQAQGLKYQLVWLDNVLEHVPDPEQTLATIASALSSGGILLVEVPNDQSALQSFLLHEQLVDRPYWLAYPEHLSYFSLQSLSALLDSAGFERCDAIADFPIDWFLFNERSNYVRDREAGRAAHLARIQFDKFIAQQGDEAALSFYRSLAAAELGRNITALFRKR
jgi:2-polyprenyl-3-methyl-5-hydroxy-6-metoxy-1,4-benzoquinol methylase